jgi:hypothetical protein
VSVAKTALAVTGGALVGAGVTWWFMRKGCLLFGQTANPTASIESAVQTHVRQLRRYAFAASQDKSPIVGLTHASYSLILLDTLEELVGRDAVKKAGYNPIKLREFITKLQDQHAEALKKCDVHLQTVLAIERAEGSPLPGFVVAGAGAAPRGA